MTAEDQRPDGEQPEPQAPSQPDPPQEPQAPSQPGGPDEGQPQAKTPEQLREERSARSKAQWTEERRERAREHGRKGAAKRASRKKAPAKPEGAPQTGRAARGAPSQSEPVVHVIHIKEDGFTVGEKVRYRGEEITFVEGTPEYESTIDRNGVSWLDMSDEEQYRRYEKLMFGRGKFAAAAAGLDPNAVIDDASPEALEEMKRREKAAQRAALAAGGPGWAREAVGNR